MAEVILDINQTENNNGTVSKVNVRYIMCFTSHKETILHVIIPLELVTNHD